MSPRSRCVRCARWPRAIAGFTLVEVLVSLFIMAIGLLGMSALQNEALKYNHAAFIDTQAQYLLIDMAERIRANRGNGLYAMLFTEDPPSSDVDCSAASCTSNQMAAWDLNQWRDNVTDGAYLPAGESQILYDKHTSTYIISIRYDWSQLGGVNTKNGKRTVSFTTRID